jgi:hypothetical protein
MPMPGARAEPGLPGARPPTMIGTRPERGTVDSGSHRAARGACHCGTVRVRDRLGDGLATARRCSFCRMRGAVAVTARGGDIEILQGADNLTLYRFNTGPAKHCFCRTCGSYTHPRRRSNPEDLGINVASLAGLSPFNFTEVTVSEGINRAGTPVVERGSRRRSAVLQIVKGESAGFCCQVPANPA